MAEISSPNRVKTKLTESLANCERPTQNVLRRSRKASVLRRCDHTNDAAEFCSFMQRTRFDVRDTPVQAKDMQRMRSVFFNCMTLGYGDSHQYKRGGRWGG